MCAASPPCSGIPSHRGARGGAVAPCRCPRPPEGPPSPAAGPRRCGRVPGGRSARGGAGRCGAGAARAVRRAAAGGIFVPFFIQQQFGVETCNRGKSRDLGGSSEPCIQEPKKINTPPHPSAPLPRPAGQRRGSAIARRTPSERDSPWRAISDRGRSIGLVGLSACRRREVAFDHFHCLPDGRIYMEVARHG